MKTSNTVAIETDINGVESNEELMFLFAKALEICQTAEIQQDRCDVSSSDTQDCLPDHVDVGMGNRMADGEDCLDNKKVVFAKVKEKMTDAGEVIYILEEISTIEKQKMGEEQVKEKKMEENFELKNNEVGVQCNEEKGSVEKMNGMHDKIQHQVTENTLKENLEINEFRLQAHYSNEIKSIYPKNDEIQNGLQVQETGIDPEKHSSSQEIDTSHNNDSHQLITEFAAQIEENFNQETNIVPKEEREEHEIDLASDENNIEVEINVPQSKKKAEKKHYICSQCNKDCHYFSQLKIHLKTHAKKGYQCKYCERVCIGPQNLEIHTRRHFGEKPHHCTFCDKAFVTRAELKLHLKIHTGIRPFKCEYCPKAFIQRFKLTEHLKIHTGVRPHKCEICEKAFTRRQYLIQHFQIHTGERPHKCEYLDCGKTFIREHDFLRHLQTHREDRERPHDCKQCGKSYTRKQYLHQHLQTHTGEKPHKCDLCPKAFIRKQDCARHLKTHTGEKAYQCQFCQKGFIRKDGLERHVKSCLHRF